MTRPELEHVDLGRDGFSIPSGEHGPCKRLNGVSIPTTTVARRMIRTERHGGYQEPQVGDSSQMNRGHRGEGLLRLYVPPPPVAATDEPVNSVVPVEWGGDRLPRRARMNLPETPANVDGGGSPPPAREDEPPSFMASDRSPPPREYGSGARNTMFESTPPTREDEPARRYSHTGAARMNRERSWVALVVTWRILARE